MKKSLTISSVLLSSVLLSLSSGAFARDPISAVGKTIEKGAVDVTTASAKVVGEAVKGAEHVAGAAVNGAGKATEDLVGAAKKEYKAGTQ